jgi:hypothetical protein
VEEMNQRALEEIMLRLLHTYPASRAKLTDPCEGGQYGKDILRLIDEFGAERVKTAIDDGVLHGFLREDGSRNRNFTPMPAEIAAHIPALKIEVKTADPQCDKCGGTSWAPLGGEAISGPRRRIVRRCDCFQVRGEA